MHMTKNPLSQRARNKGLLLAFLVGGMGAALVASACSSGSGGTTSGDNPDSSTSSSGSGGGSGSGSGGGVGDAGSCANSTIPIIFEPMYSAYIPGQHRPVLRRSPR
jgi:hypothetical protein